MEVRSVGEVFVVIRGGCVFLVEIEMRKRWSVIERGDRNKREFI